ncbi:hypothetical protein Peur_008812 [Populus x canadensis]
MQYICYSSLHKAESFRVQPIILIWQGKREKCSNFNRLNRQDGAVSVGKKASKQHKSSGPGRDPLDAIVGVAHHINESSDFISPPASGVNKEEQHSGPSS